MEEKFKSNYKELLETVEERISSYIDIKKPEGLYEPFSYIMEAGGKRIRPILTLVSAGIFNKNPLEALDAAVAIEILHNFTLVHDDIMDQSPIRRGKETVHSKWDEPTAIITGDVMVGYAYRLIANYSSHPKFSSILDAFTKGLIYVCEGQSYDMEFNSKDLVSLEDYFLMIKMKTAALLQSCVCIGASIGKAKNEEIKTLIEFATNLGIGFQIQDDLLDISAHQAKFGKKIGQDIIEGKKTFLIITAKAKAKKKEDIQLLDLFYQNHGLSEEYIPKMQEMFDRLGVLEETKNKADEYFNQASIQLNRIKDNYYTQMLHWIADSLRVRNY